MFDPQSTSKSPLSSRIALPVALLLAAAFGLCIAIIEPNVVLKKSQAVEQAKPATEINPTAPVEAAPGIKLPAPDAQGLVKFCSENVTATRSFVVFRNGTCVVVNEPSADPMKAAREILSSSYNEEAKFVTEMTAEGDMIVAFETAVFHRFSPVEMTSLHNWMKSSGINFLTQKELLAAGEGWTPPANAQMGLLARRRMLDDSLNAVPIKVIRAKDRAVAAR
jgi:hypothetical protein